MSTLSNLSDSYIDLIDFLLKWLSKFSYVNKRKNILALTYTECAECVSTFHEGILSYLDIRRENRKNDVDEEVQHILSQLYHMIPKPRNPLIQKSKKSLRTHDMVLFLVDLRSALEILLSDEEEISLVEWNDFLNSLFNLKLFQGQTIIRNKNGINSDERSLYSKEHILENSNHIYIIHRWPSPCRYHAQRTIENELTVRDLLVSFFEIKSGKHDLWYELFCDSICKVNARSGDLIRQEIQCIKDRMCHIRLFEPYLATLIHDYAYSKQEMMITLIFDHGS
jgi:hypothetical protein